MRLIFLITIFFISAQAKLYAAENVLLRLHGSNTIGAELAPRLVKEWLAFQGYKNIRQSEKKVNEYVINADDDNGHSYAVEIKAHGSGTGFESIKNGLTDIAMSSRPIKKSEYQELIPLDDLLDADAEYVIGLDGIAVIVNRDNPVSSLEKETVMDIFSGRVRNWSEVDKSMSGPIRVYARDDRSGTYDTFKSLVLGKGKSLVTGALRYESNADLSDDVAKDKNSIGFVGLPYVRHSKSIAVAEKGALPRSARPFEVATEDYALSRRLFMYVPVIEGKPVARSFIDYCLSAMGQNIVERTGFISQELMTHEVALDAGFPEEYLRFTEDSQRLSLNFRFKKGSVRLDNKAVRDVGRLVEFMSREDNKNKQLMLFGFAESFEAIPVLSLDLSVFRADQVSDLLVKNGIDPVRVRGYGSAIPVASNEEPGGRHKNRRVEVWVK